MDGARCTAFDEFASKPYWVGWRNEARGKEGKPTKVPYGAGGRKAKADDPTTWLVRSEAEALAQRIVNGLGGGIGYELGDIGNDLFVAGIDLDSCIAADGTLAPWAATILKLPYVCRDLPSGAQVVLSSGR
jgi:primase-polymerase (primpol)-like protein